MDAYNGLNVFPEIPAAMKLLEENNSSVDHWIFSNGTMNMVAASIQTSPALSASRVFHTEKIVTVEPIKCFKPDKRTYDHLAQEVGLSADASSIWVVSANPFDALGARAAGLNSAWVDRAGLGWIDALGTVMDTTPTVVAAGVDEAIQKILAHAI
jgi:2-haloacid dehalogenase